MHVTSFFCLGALFWIFDSLYLVLCIYMYMQHVFVCACLGNVGPLFINLINLLSSSPFSQPKRKREKKNVQTFTLKTKSTKEGKFVNSNAIILHDRQVTYLYIWTSLFGFWWWDLRSFFFFLFGCWGWYEWIESVLDSWTEIGINHRK